MRKILILALCLSLSQCTTTVKINTDPEGLDIYYQNMRLGKSPVEAVMPDGVFESYYLEIKKDRKFLRTVRLATEVKALALVGGICFLVPFIWVVGPRSYQQYTIDEAFDKKALKSESALVVSHLPAGVEMIVGTKVLMKDEYAYLDGKEYQVKICDQDKCTDLGKHRFENDHGYFYQLESSIRY